jgi:tRNA(Leu) C34 or U34 (ribose-2'-O)-methylase TrmL
MPMSTNGPDQALARDAIATGRALEALWGPRADPDRSLAGQPAEAAFCEAFRAAIARADFGRDPSLRRLARYADGARPGLTLRALIAILAPFERWAGSGLRDDQILPTGDDRIARAPSAHPASMRDRAPLVAVLDNIRSAFNVGSILRAAECAGCESVALTGYTPSPSNSLVERTAMGAQALVPWQAYARLGEAARDLRQSGFRLVALETASDAVDLYQMQWPEKCALLVGNERFGLGAEALREADAVCRIPMLGQKNSLNVASALAIAAFERRRAERRLAAWREREQP